MSRRPHRVIRTLDLAVLGMLAPLWTIALGTCALAVAIGSGRPLLFRQVRTGRNGRPFTLLKFRSMHTGPNALVPDHASITSVGAWLRRFSLDELPQLINVVRGEMSLVGPRPMLPEQTAVLRDEQHLRHVVRPGLTGLAQVNGRNTLRWEERFSFDCAWAARPSVRTYLNVLRASVRVVLSGSGIDGHDPADPVVDLASTHLVHDIDLDLVDTTSSPAAGYVRNRAA